MSADRQYELVYITPPETTEEALAELHQQVVDRRRSVPREDRAHRALGPPPAGL